MSRMLRRHPRKMDRNAAVALTCVGATLVVVGCSFQSFDHLQEGDEPSASGGSNTGGGGGSAGQDVGSGGTTTDGGAGNEGGVIGCVTHSVADGVLIAELSNGFEEDHEGWVSRGESPLTRSDDIDPVCEGSWYLVAEGALRIAEWDGPQIDLGDSVTAGHQYEVTLAARYDPTAPPAFSRALIFTLANRCGDAEEIEFTRLDEGSSNGNWVRLVGQLDVPADGCAVLQLYVETAPSETGLSVHIDDFRIWDLSDHPGSGGAGGTASGVSGAAGGG